VASANAGFAGLRILKPDMPEISVSIDCHGEALIMAHQLD
jgi:hypothetical protein